LCAERRADFYVFVPVLARPGFGLPGALGTVPLAAAGFFLSALGLLGSRLLLFCPFAIAVLQLGHQRAATNNRLSGSAPAIETARLSTPQRLISPREKQTLCTRQATKRCLLRARHG
jgi:hypothetical protein